MSSAAADEVIELRVGDERTLWLAGLGTAGYRWTPQVEGDPGVASVHVAGTAPAAGEAVGASASEGFSIRAERPGEALVRFAQRRPWDAADAVPAAERTVFVRVT